jgi:hypothetical protein
MKVPSMDFRGQKFVDENGNLTSTAQSFFDMLQVLMVQNLGDEGLVMPTQSAADIVVIQDNTEANPNGLVTKTCEYGTMIYDETNNLAKVALNDGTGNPIFKQIVTM